MTDENLNVAACRHSMRINGNKMKKDSFKIVIRIRIWIGGPRIRIRISNPDPDLDRPKFSPLVKEKLRNFIFEEHEHPLVGLKRHI
jgi:hypothetical protein